MGTLVMHNGQVVRSCMLVRSGCLAKATDSDVAVLKEKYRLSDVFDFRFEAEVNAAPDRIIDGVSYTHLSTLLLYIENQLGFSKEEQQQLRKKYTTTY